MAVWPDSLCPKPTSSQLLRSALPGFGIFCDLCLTCFFNLEDSKRRGGLPLRICSQIAAEHTWRPPTTIVRCNLGIFWIALGLKLDSAWESCKRTGSFAAALLPDECGLQCCGVIYTLQVLVRENSCHQPSAQLILGCCNLDLCRSRLCLT